MDSQEKYRKLFDNIDEGFCVIKVLFDKNNQPIDFKFLEVNSAFVKQTGFANAVNKTMRELEPNHENHWFDIFGKVAVSGDSIHFKRSAKALGRYYDVYAFPFGEPGSHDVAVLFNDITERKKNDYTNAWLGAIIESSVDAIISKDLDGVITSWNSSAERVFGYSSDEVIGKNISLLIPENYSDEEIEILDQLKVGERIQQFETIRLRKDGTFIDVSLTISPIKNSDGDIMGAAKIVRDISKRKEAEKELKQMNETLEERVDQRTEELRSYQNQLRFLASGLNESEEQQRNSLATELHNNIGQMLAIANIKINSLESLDLSENIKEEIHELSEIIHDALSYTRELMSDLQPPPSFNKEDFSEVLGWLAGKMKKYDLNVTIKDDGKPKPIGNDVRLTLQQSVQELLFNVVKHANTNNVTIDYRLGEYDTVQISVKDDGKGFTVSDKPPVPTHAGGFGLFNIYEQMDFLGGKFKLISNTDNGTEAILKAPLKKEDIAVSSSKEQQKSAAEKKDQKKEEKNIFEKICIMLVDDHKMVRTGLQKMVGSQDDLEIIAEASNGEEAVELAPNIFPDIIVMDIDLPGMNGIEATQKISELMPHTPIIGFSLHDDQKLRDDMEKAGASAYMAKEEGFENLCALIREHVRKNREE